VLHSSLNVVSARNKRALRRIVVRTASGAYAVLCGRGVLGRTGEHVGRLGKNTGVFLISSPRVWKHWGRRLAGSFRRAGGTKVILFDDRESSKNMRTVERLCRWLVRAGADRRAVIFAMGGGVVGDVAGFAAASFLRGVALVHVPTTLVAQADSAIGGKTGVNLADGKNLVGAFYSPRLVLADPATLATLPERDYRSGLYEVIKYGVIGDPQLFAFLEHNMDRLLRRDAVALDWILPRCIRAKADVVGRDERETGLREILNFGHTIGHAIEGVTGYRKFLHGEAVGWGMLAATLIGVAMDLLAPSSAARILRLVPRVGRLPALPVVPPARLLAFMHADKKARGGHLRFVLPRRIGRVETVAGVPEALIAKVMAVLPDLVRQGR
jgi:3-dehydroquinate synthase